MTLLETGDRLVQTGFMLVCSLEEVHVCVLLKVQYLHHQRGRCPLLMLQSGCCSGRLPPLLLGPQEEDLRRHTLPHSPISSTNRKLWSAVCSSYEGPAGSRRAPGAPSPSGSPRSAAG